MKADIKAPVSRPRKAASAQARTAPARGAAPAAVAVAVAAKAGSPRSGSASNMLSLERAIALLSVVCQSDGGLRLKDAAQALGLSTSTTHRILTALVEFRMLRLPEGSHVYIPGSELYRLGQAAARHYSLVDLARPGMRRLAERTQDTVFLSARDRDEAVCLERVIGDYPIKTLTLSIGDRRPLGVGAGSLALLAALPADERAVIANNAAAREQRYPAYTAAALRKWADEAARLGYAHNPERIIPGMSAVGVAVRDAAGRPLGAISIAGIRSRIQGKRLLEIVKLIREECDIVAEKAAALNNPKGMS
jgi:DNA-binding IclR family transcriptional regulator